MTAHWTSTQTMINNTIVQLLFSTNLSTCIDNYWMKWLSKVAALYCQWDIATSISLRSQFHSPPYHAAPNTGFPSWISTGTIRWPPGLNLSCMEWLQHLHQHVWLHRSLSGIPLLPVSHNQHAQLHTTFALEHCLYCLSACSLMCQFNHWWHICSPLMVTPLSM